MHILLALSSFALAAAQGLNPVAPLCPFPIIIQSLVLIQKAPVYVSAQICEVTTLTVGGRTIPVPQVPTLLETRFVVTSTVTQSSTWSSTCGTPATNANDFHSSEGSFVTLTAPCTEAVASTLVIPPVGDQPGTKVILVPITTPAPPFTGPCDTLTQTWARTFCTTITIPVKDGGRGTVLVVQNPTQNAPAPIQPIITAAKSPSSAAPSPEALSVAKSDTLTLWPGRQGTPSVSNTSGGLNLITPSGLETSLSATSPTTTVDLTLKSSPSAISPTTSRNNNPMNTGDMTSTTSPSKTNPTTAGDLTLRDSISATSPTTTGGLTLQTSPIDASSGAPPVSTTTSTSTTAGLITSTSTTSTSLCIVTATPVAECCMNELPDDCKALRTSNGQDLQPVISACQQAIGNYTTSDMRACWAGEVTDDSRGTNIADCLMDELEDCCITQLPAACSSLRGATGAAVLAGALQCRKALGLFVHGTAKPCLDDKNITAETHGMSIVDCLEAAYGFRSGAVTISDAQLCPTITVT
ncbi:uncharacterized protein E0L32_000679 [Thyridium curvatum]|uniref:Uncharacterized protein n=1 Tax=Thyridium curvatum TaxID=1093900 RepID=A0A507AR68_9PEZI|nr:uncharacterized protein E0L32_000679 [Thyridium curvatum]TPX12502.1 hypothetical protein E0L32_000679 [Thyridium curvatum]